MEKDFKFEGFDSPNSTQVPDQLFDRLLSRLNGAELKVLLYIIRRTFGFKKINDNISINQISKGIITKKGKVLDNGTGLSRSTVIRTIKSLLQKNIIIANRRANKTKGNLPTTYSLNIISPSVSNETRGVSSVTLGLVRKSNPQLNSITSNNNVSKQTLEESYQTEALVLQMLDILGDSHSKNFYRKVAKKCPPQIIFTALSEVKDNAHRGRIKKSKGAFFTDLIKRYAQRQGIKLT